MVASGSLLFVQGPASPGASQFLAKANDLPREQSFQMQTNHLESNPNYLLWGLFFLWATACLLQSLQGPDKLPGVRQLETTSMHQSC